MRRGDVRDGLQVKGGLGTSQGPRVRLDPTGCERERGGGPGRIGTTAWMDRSPSAQAARQRQLGSHAGHVRSERL